MLTALYFHHYSYFSRRKAGSAAVSPGSHKLADAVHSPISLERHGPRAGKGVARAAHDIGEGHGPVRDGDRQRSGRAGRKIPGQDDRPWSSRAFADGEWVAVGVPSLGVLPVEDPRPGDLAVIPHTAHG